MQNEDNILFDKLVLVKEFVGWQAGKLLIRENDSPKPLDHGGRCSQN